MSFLLTNYLYFKAKPKELKSFQKVLPAKSPKPSTSKPKHSKERPVSDHDDSSSDESATKHDLLVILCFYFIVFAHNFFFIFRPITKNLKTKTKN